MVVAVLAVDVLPSYVSWLFLIVICERTKKIRGQLKLLCTLKLQNSVFDVAMILTNALLMIVYCCHCYLENHIRRSFRIRTGGMGLWPLSVSKDWNA